MSRDFFDKDRLIPHTDSSPYQKGTQDPDSIENIVDQIFRWGGRSGDNRMRLKEELATLIQSPADGQKIIDAAIGHLKQATIGRQKEGDLMLAYLVELYQEIGYHHFTLDYRNVPAMTMFAQEISGTEEQALSLVYHLPDRKSSRLGSAASHIMHCHIEFHGVIDSVGFNAHLSEVLLHDAPGHLGYKAEESDFYIPWGQEESVSIEGAAYSSQRWYSYPTKEGEDDMKIAETFFEFDNRLLIPDDSGGWKEVRPDE